MREEDFDGGDNGVGRGRGNAAEQGSEGQEQMEECQDKEETELNEVLAEFIDYYEENTNNTLWGDNF